MSRTFPFTVETDMDPYLGHQFTTQEEACAWALDYAQDCLTGYASVYNDKGILIQKFRAVDYN